jgi:hypothetical protein
MAEAVAFVNGVLLLTSPVGVEQASGFADGDDVIMLEFREDQITDKVGADGKMTISVSADKSCKLTLKMQQTSPTNSYLSKLMDLQAAIRPSFAVLAATFQDAQRQDVASLLAGYITKHASLKRGKQATDVEWVMHFERGDVLFGAPELRRI